MRRIFASCALLLIAGVSLILAAIPGRSQQYPVNNPAYLPTPTLASQTITTGVASNYAFQTNGVSTMYLRIAGSPSGLAATVQGTEARTGTPAWTTLAIQPVGIVGSAHVASISATGLYRLNVAGLAQVRLAVSALTSGVTTVSMSAGVGERFLDTMPAYRASYSAASIIATGGTTHFLVIAGSATKTVRVTRQECSGKATGALAVNITANKNSTADSVDAGTAVTATPHDSQSPAATATVVSHTTSPTSGTLVGAVRAGTLALVVGATPITPANVLSFDYATNSPVQDVVLRGVAESLSLDTSAAFGSGAAVTCSTTWTEE